MEEKPTSEGSVAGLSGLTASPNGNYQMVPIMYPVIFPGLLQNQEELNRGAGVYAVPVLPYGGHIVGLPSNTLIPLTYNLPTRTTTEGGAVGEEQGGQQQAVQQQQAGGPQRQVVVRRFQIAIRLDLTLILKLAAVIFLFNQDGSRQRLVLLVFLASLVYLYQTGALTPLIRWLSQGMQRAAPPHPPRPPVRGAAENVPAAAAAAGEGENENDGLVGEGNQRDNNEEEQALVGGGGNNNRWWGIVKEVQMIVFGFITSLLPGFHNID